MKKRYKVFVESVSVYWNYVEADSVEEANEIASELDGGDWVGDGISTWDLLPEFTQEAGEIEK